MKCTFVFIPLLGLVLSPPPATAQERIPTPLTESIAREAAPLGTEAALAAQDGSASATQANSSRPAETLTTGARVRVTAAAVVEVPGLVRHESPETRIFGGPIRASDAETVTVRGPDGGSVTIPQPRGRVTGRIDRWDGQTLTISRKDGSVVSIPRAAIARLERFDGQSSRQRSAGLGFLISAGIGAGLAGALLVGNGADLGDSWAAGIVVMSGAAFGGVGALVGAIAEPKDRWTKVDVSALDK